MGNRSSSANRWSSHFHNRNRDPLLPPASAVISSLFALGYAFLLCVRHHARIPVMRTIISDGGLVEHVKKHGRLKLD